MTRSLSLGQEVLVRCHELAAFSEVSGAIARTFLSDPMRGCHRYLSQWMESIGIDVSVDAVGNLRGYYAGKNDNAKRLIIGSHLDTVPNAGRYDGVLGVILGIALIELIEGKRLPFALEIVGFSEEEGVRFGVPFIGSRALVGNLNAEALAIQDKAGVSVEEAILHFGLDPSRIVEAALGPSVVGYLEFHIEQGPVLESLGLGLGVVEAIAGQSRALVQFRGTANHAGTTPMNLRRDALAGAAEWILRVEQEARSVPGLVATVGSVQVTPGASNVIPGEAEAALDVRHAVDTIRREAVERMVRHGEDVASRRNLTFEHTVRLDQAAVAMDATLVRIAEDAIAAAGVSPHRMVSGAGHDAMIIAGRLPSAMIFLRSPGGVSHHPDETVLVEDAELALRAGLHFLEKFSGCSYIT
jgi:allantoate deiminase